MRPSPRKHRSPCLRTPHLRPFYPIHTIADGADVTLGAVSGSASRRAPASGVRRLGDSLQPFARSVPLHLREESVLGIAAMRVAWNQRSAIKEASGFVDGTKGSDVAGGSIRLTEGKEGA